MANVKFIRVSDAILGIDDLDSIRLPPGENFGIISDDEDLQQELEELENETGFANIIVVDNLPKVPKEKIGKLEAVIHQQINSKIGFLFDSRLKWKMSWMPIDPSTERTRGYYFIEYNTPRHAEVVMLNLNGYKLDKSHTIAVKLLDEFDELMQVPDEWAPPPWITRPYTPGVNLQQWLTDEKGRDQFVIRTDTDIEVLWNDARHLKPDLVYKRTYWTERPVQWSPLGTYLATLHLHGATVWGGATTFNLLMWCEHPQVKLIEFSPGERFLVTYSSLEPSNPQDIHWVVLNIYDVRSGKLMRAFQGHAHEFGIRGPGGVIGVSWPVFRWVGGKDDKYFARIGKDFISVYETETFTLTDQKSIKVANVMDVCWSPTDPILALFVPEHDGGNQPARVSLVQIPSKEKVRQKILFSVSDCKMYWQSNGDYLAVKVERYTKTKKSTYTDSFVLFRIKERDIPIEVLELENKNDKVIAFAWEPKGHRFAVIHRDHNNNNPRLPSDVTFYSMRTAHNTAKVSKLATLKGMQANALYWSPAGRFIVLAGPRGLNGQLVFYNVDKFETMAMAELMATHIQWDPTGRYVATAVTSVHEMENGFKIWSFNGKLLYGVEKDRLLQFSWRQRPPSLLTPEKEEEIRKNLKKYSKKYEAEDEDVSLPLSEQERTRGSNGRTGSVSE